jgi:hypothetical protein
VETPIVEKYFSNIVLEQIFLPATLLGYHVGWKLMEMPNVTVQLT